MMLDVISMKKDLISKKTQSESIKQSLVNSNSTRKEQLHNIFDYIPHSVLPHNIEISRKNSNQTA